MVIKTSALCAASMARSHWSSGSISPNQTIAGRRIPPQRQSGGKCSNGHLLVPAFAPTRGASQQPDVTVQFHHVLAAGPFVQAIHVLRHQGEPFRVSALHFRQGEVPGIGLRRMDQAAQPVIPFPNQAGIARKGLGGAKLFRRIISPQPIRSPKGRNMALRRNTSTRKSHNLPGAQAPPHRFGRAFHSPPILDKKFCRKFDTMLHRKRLSMR